MLKRMHKPTVPTSSRVRHRPRKLSRSSGRGKDRIDWCHTRIPLSFLCSICIHVHIYIYIIPKIIVHMGAHMRCSRNHKVYKYCGNTKKRGANAKGNHSNGVTRTKALVLNKVHRKGGTLPGPLCKQSVLGSKEILGPPVLFRSARAL